MVYVSVNKNAYLIPTSRSTKNKHNQLYIIPDAGPDYYNKSYCPRTIRDNNELTPDIVEAANLDTFKSRLATRAKD